MARGDQRHLVTLEQPGDPVPDGLGGFTEAWTPLDPPTWYAAITAATARDLERLAAGSTLQTTELHLVRGDFHPGVTTETRLSFEGRAFEVQSVQDPEQRHVDLILLCTEITDAN
jgi:head-tail adaptor